MCSLESEEAARLDDVAERRHAVDARQEVPGAEVERLASRKIASGPIATCGARSSEPRRAVFGA